jgi:hypothetical protein
MRNPPRLRFPNERFFGTLQSSIARAKSPIPIFRPRHFAPPFLNCSWRLLSGAFHMQSGFHAVGRIRITFTHRDPRDVILSAMDHCASTKGTAEEAMQEFTSVHDSIPSVRPPSIQSWRAAPLCQGNVP